ncbi:MAG TPA: translocation/assembly module TamB domain-containing protein [Saprospiraceae bacterium]|nr:translocation/assembly module TamB domain-containing protein [Saprospiraceae bacterium]
MQKKKQHWSRRAFRRFWKFLLVLLSTAGLFLTLFLIGFFLLASSAFTDWSKNSIINFLKNKVENRIEYGSFELNVFKGGKITDLLIYDHHGDTLIYSKLLHFQLSRSLGSLLKNEISLKEVDLDDGLLKVIGYVGENDNSLTHFINQFSKSKSSTKKKFKLELSDIKLKNFRHFRDRRETGVREYYYVQDGSVKVEQMNFPANYILLNSVNLKGPAVLISHDPNVIPPESKAILDSVYSCTNPFVIFIKKANLEKGYFAFDRTGNVVFEEQGKDHVDFKHFSVDEIEGSLSNFFYSDFESNGVLHELKARLNNKMRIQSFKAGKIDVSNNKTTLENFTLETDRSFVGDSLYLTYGSYKDFKNFNNRVFLQLVAKSNTVNLDEVKYFSPSLANNAFFTRNKDVNLGFSGDIAGKVNSLKLFNFKAHILHDFVFEGDISTRNLTKKGSELLNIKSRKLSTSMNFLRKLLPQIKPNAVYDKLGEFSFVGGFDGYFEDFVAAGKLNTGLGQVRSDVRLNLRPGKDHATFAGSLDLIEFDIGELLKVKDLGKTNLKAYIRNGEGLSANKINADLEANVSSLSFKNYNYSNINFNGKLSKDYLDGSVKVKDKNLDLNFEGRISDINTSPNFVFKATIAKADLKELNLSKSSLIVSADLISNFRNTDLKKLDGDVRVEKTLIYNYEKNRVLGLGEIYFTQKRNAGLMNTTLQSDFLNAEMVGDYRLNSIYDQLITFFYQQYPDLFNEFEIAHNFNESASFFEAKLEAKSLNRIFNFFDINTRIEEFQGDIKYNSAQQFLNFDYTIQSIVSGDFSMNSSSGYLKCTRNEFESDINFPDISWNKRFNLRAVKFNTYFKDNKLKFFFSGKDSSGTKPYYDIGINLVSGRGQKKFSFDHPDLLFQGEQWQIHPQAELEFNKKNFSLRNMVFSDSGRSLRLEDISNKGLKVMIQGFNLSFINDFLINKSVYMSGIFDAYATVDNVYNVNNLNGKISVGNFRMNSNSYGRLVVDFDLPDPMRPMNVVVSNQYKETSIDGKGTFNLPLKSGYNLPKYDFLLDFNATAFPISFLENFMTSIGDTKGTLDGKFTLEMINKNIYGSGSLLALNGTTLIKYLNTRYFFDKQTVRFDKNKIVFNEVNIKDELGNPIKVDGNIRHENFARYFMDVTVNSDKALVLDTKKGNNLYYYGYGLFDFIATFKGPTSSMEMDISGRSVKGTKLVIPVRSDREATDTKFVRFRSKDTSVVIAKPAQTTIKGMNVRMNLEINEEAEVSIIFDEQTGDILTGTGRGNLQIASLRDNTFSIKGSYEVDRGEYLFTLFNFVNKPFKIKKGGTIVWTGDPFGATIKIEASYEGLTASPSNLLQEFIVNNEELKQAAKARTPVDLTMILTGSLLKPDINFTLSFPELTGSLKTISDNKIRFLEQNPDQLNQQVAALIAFRTFIGTNSNLGLVAGIGNTTINTMSEFLSSQLSIFVTNLLSEAFEDVDFISGVDFNINYDVDKNQLGQTRLNEGAVVFSLKHRLWNDQWAVTLGGNYVSNSTIYGNTYFNPESVIEWNTPVPGLKMRIYYKGVDSIEGVRHRVGAGVTYRKEFDTLFDFKKGIKEQKKGEPKDDKSIN